MNQNGPDSRSVQTESPERATEEANCMNISPRDKEAGQKHEVGRRHRPLSSRNIPCGLISEPQRVVAEISGEFSPAEGGELKIPEHGVELSIPPGAIPDDGNGEKQEIYLRVYEGTNRKVGEEEQDLEKKSHIVSPVIMCGPRGLRFQKPIKLTMPRFHTHSGGPSEPEVSKQYVEEGKAHQSASSSSSWSLRVLHAATQSDAITTSASASASESEMRSHALRQWRTVRPPLSNIIEPADSSSKPTVASAPPLRQLSGTESDSSGAAITYKVAESFISLLIDHF
ncbi:unnamed protein product [Rodentolepis nana]|uniref:ZU5 domain-containing protein n=1 Tax=Rodentolepis nana TaxID=102285 RepID=A0A0R3TS02_RODNA|nr:unnamed protein product [Rodentolepis nana]